MSRRTSAPVVASGLSSTTPSRQTERAREMLSQGVANQAKPSSLPEESPQNVIHMIRLMLSCLHAWRLDHELDGSCEQVLGLVRPARPVSFGLLSKGGHMSLVLPGWGLRATRTSRAEATTSQLLLEKASAESDVSVEGTPEASAKLPYMPTFDQKYHLRWQLSRALTTQHLLTMVSVTNTLMNQALGAHQLARSSAVRPHPASDDSDSDGEDHTLWDNQIRAVWSRVWMVIRELGRGRG